MSLTLWLYLVDVADSAKAYFGVATFLSVIVLIATFIVACAMCDTGSEVEWKLLRRWVIAASSILVFSSLATVLIPKERTLYLMLGAKTAEDIVVNPKVREAGGKVMDLINKKLDELAKKESK